MFHANPALVLNADYRPLNLYPLSTMDWQRAIKNVFEGNLAVVAEYDQVLRSPSIEMRLPAVVAMKRYVPVHQRVAFTRQNVFLRDRFKCQYCGEEKELTFDHVVPRSRGGDTCWTNIVAACDDCNGLKGSRTDMQPMKVPREPTAAELLALKRALAPKIMHESWRDYLPVDLAA
jgi:5-methylcytosine-specific restriction endonuclease McrA